MSASSTWLAWQRRHARTAWCWSCQPATSNGSAAWPVGTHAARVVRNGLAAVPSDADIICVHDAARPLASSDLFRSVIDAVADGADGAVPGAPVTDTIKIVDRDDASVTVSSTPARESLVAVQTPQAFRAAMLRAAHASGAEATDDAALVELLGGCVVVVPGETDEPQDHRPR